MLKRLARAALVTIWLIAALSAIWLVVRTEVGLRVHTVPAPSSGPFDDESLSLLDQVAVEVEFVQGKGAEGHIITLADGTWRATAAAADASTANVYIESTGDAYSRVGWNLSILRSAVFMVGDPSDQDVALYGNEFLVHTDAIDDDHRWSVTFERFEDPRRLR